MPKTPNLLRTQNNLSAVDLAVGWASYITKIESDRPLTNSVRGVWNEYDLVSALFARDRVENALLQTDIALREKLMQYVNDVDERFRALTADDSGQRISVIGDVRLTDKGWWWFRVPTDGPIAQDLANYDEHGNYIENNTQSQ